MPFVAVLSRPVSRRGISRNVRNTRTFLLAEVCHMTVLALLIAVLGVFVVGTMLLLGAHWFSVLVAKSLEKLIEVE
jgi:hypothetical protein